MLELFGDLLRVHDLPFLGASAEQLAAPRWENVESIRAFAGERWQEAVITPDEEHLLKDTWIGHYEAL